MVHGWGMLNTTSTDGVNYAGGNLEKVEGEVLWGERERESDAREKKRDLLGASSFFFST